MTIKAPFNGDTVDLFDGCTKCPPNYLTLCTDSGIDNLSPYTWDLWLWNSAEATLYPFPGPDLKKLGAPTSFSWNTPSWNLATML